ncbi:glycosyltransferase family 4 protein [Niallia sp. NCCP-28]|uniref:glycosyltransferase family 4 protein n=1 Tax=Niallia sp. NCCP-28 TaxID=2934712 RepID=UPI0020832EB4|nr:glycosyltransferase family 4 protein [Niallia sp. NCCP-28]GKU84891.1 LPS biosynthesis RfbU related protein [Niallia sp. NCCP-28]
MNILLINTFYYPTIIGGAEISVQKLAEGLVKNGHNVSVVCTDKEDKYEILNGVQVFRIKIKNMYDPIESQKQGIIRKSIYRIIDLYNIFNYKRLREIFIKVKPDVVHTNNTYGISPVIWSVSKKLNVPIVHTLRDYYLMYPYGNLTNSESGKSLLNIYEKLHKSFHRFISSKVNYVTAPSKFTLDKFIEKDFFYKSQKKVIFNAIDFNKNTIDQWYANKISKTNNKVTKFVYLGTLGEHKGVHILLNAFHEIEDNHIELHIAGKGTLQNMVEEFEQKDSRIKYHGFLQGENLEKLLLQCDVLLAPSVWYEPFGRVVIDGYKHALMVIGSSSGGLAEIIKDGKTGLLIEPNSSESLKLGINKLKKSENKEQLLINCREELNTFSIEKQIKDFETIYYSLISKYKL